jgi:DNA polymerase-3 subunit delta
MKLNNLASIYLLSGDEPLLIQEQCAAIRTRAKQEGFTERQFMQADKNFNWQNLAIAANNLSLFSEKTIIELNMPNAKPGDAGSKALQAYVKNLPNDKILLITTSKLDASAQKSKWFKALESAGVFIAIWPIDKLRLPQWIAQRMQQNQLKTTPEGLKLLAEYSEGNLLSLAQEIEKLRLLYGPGNLSTEQIALAIADNSRFNIFDLVDNALIGNSKKIIHILHCLKNEKTEPTLILWALARELRTLASMSKTMQQGYSADQVIQQFHVWQKRKPCIKQALQSHAYNGILELLQQCAALDRIIKGVTLGNIWDELENLCLKLSAS